MSRGFIESSTIGFARDVTRTMLSEQTARQRGLLQGLDPRVRVVGLFALVLAVTLSHRIAVVAALFGAAVVIALCSRVSLVTLAKRVWLIVLGFTGVIALPALFVTPGRVVATIAGFAVTVALVLTGSSPGESGHVGPTTNVQYWDIVGPRRAEPAHDLDRTLHLAPPAVDLGGTALGRPSMPTPQLIRFRSAVQVLA